MVPSKVPSLESLASLTAADVAQMKIFCVAAAGESAMLRWCLAMLRREGVRWSALKPCVAVAGESAMLRWCLAMLRQEGVRRTALKPCRSEEHTSELQSL